MKSTISWIVTTLILSFASINSYADEFTAETLHGNWLYTHILMESGQKISVNFSTAFLKDGTVIYSDPMGNEISRGTFAVKDNTVMYEDAKGPQSWKFVSFEDGQLLVDHKGAEMFFERK